MSVKKSAANTASINTTPNKYGISNSAVAVYSVYSDQCFVEYDSAISVVLGRTSVCTFPWSPFSRWCRLGAESVNDDSLFYDSRARLFLVLF